MWDDQHSEGSRHHSTDVAPWRDLWRVLYNSPSVGSGSQLILWESLEKIHAQDHLRKLNQNLRGGNLKSC